MDRGKAARSCIRGGRRYVDGMTSTDATKPADRKKPLHPAHRARIRGLTLVDERTIKRWWSGENVHHAIADKLAAAAAQLGVL